jgi:hypothetical protein
MSVIPARRTLHLFQGATLDQTLTVYRDRERTLLKDLTDFHAALQVRKDFASPGDPLLSLSDIPAIDDPPTLSGIVLGGTAGTIRIYATDEKLRDIPLSGFKQVNRRGDVLGLGYWDLELTNPDGETFRYLRGPVEFSPEVTRT